MDNKEKTAAVQPEETKAETGTQEASEKPGKKKEGKLKKLLKTRKVRHGSVAVAITAVAVALVIVLNIVVGLLVDRFPNLKVDFTSNQAYALQDDTREYIKSLKKDVTVYILFTKNAFEQNGEYFVQAENLLEKMEKSSDGKLKVVYKDTSTDPAFTKNYPNINWDSKTNLGIVESGKQYKALTLEECFTYDEEYAAQGIYQYDSTTIEQAVVKGALYVTTENKVKVDVITDCQPGDYSGVTSLLNDNAYQVNEISLISKDLEKDADFALLFAPSVDLDEAQTEKISAWLKNGGKYGKNLIYVASYKPLETPNINALLSDWGMAVNTGYVFETDPNHLQTGANAYTFIAEYTEEYVENLKNQNIPVIVSSSHPIDIKDDSVAKPVLQTTDRAGIEPVDAGDDWDYNKAVKGEAIAVAAEGTKASGDSTSRLIVFGTDSMLLKALMQYNSFNNSAYIMNIFNTISDKDDETVVIEGKSLDSAELGITDQTSTAAILVIFVIIIPLAVIVLGIVMWILRRNK